MKTLTSILLVLSLAGCQSSVSTVDNGQALRGVDTITELCLDEVAYYFYSRGNKVALAVRINPETLKPATCK